MGLLGVTHKLLCWIIYVSSSSVIQTSYWSSFDHLNGILENIQFTMKMEKEDSHVFLNNDIYHKLDVLLVRKVYLKPMQPYLYLNSNSHHYTSNEQAVLSVLVHRTRCLCDWESLHSKLEFFRVTFRQNACRVWQI
jgi:hypothetical protein